MTTAYTSLLGLALPVTGELAGQWGTTVNDYITQYIDAAVEGTQTISGSQTAVTLSTTNGSALSQAGSGATGSAQYAVINCTGNPASTLTVTVPASSRNYIVINATSTSQSVAVVGVGPTTGVTLVSGEKAVVVWNGSDFVKVASTVVPASSITGTVAVANGGTGQSTYTDGQLLIGNSTGNTLTKATLTAGSGVSITNGGGSISIAATGSGGTVTSVSWTGGIVSVANGTTTPAFTIAGTSGGIPYFSSASTWATSAALTANAIVLGGGAGAAPATTTTGTGVVTAVGNSVNTSGGLVTQSGTLASSAILLGGGSGTAISSTTTGTGVVTALGNNANATGGFATIDGTATLTNKRIDPRVTSTTTASSLTPSIATADQYAYTALASALTINAVTGTPTDGDKMIFRILDNGTSRTITFTGGVSGGFRPIGTNLTASGSDFTFATTVSKLTYFGCIYNANADRWDVVALTTQA